MKIGIIINAHRMTEELKTQLNDPSLAEKFNITYDVYVKNVDEFSLLIKSLNHESYNAYLIGGGDGTVQKFIQLIKDIPVPIAILPLGTFNLLAKSLNHPNDIESIFAIIKNNKTKQIDIAEANGQVFINHAWIGFYYHLLKSRKKHQHFLKNSKVLKIIFNTLNVFKVVPIYNLKFRVDNQEKTFNTCLVFIGNNESYTNLFDFGEHKYLSSGLLSVNILKCETRWRLLQCLFSILFKSFKNNDNVISFNTDKLEITAHTKIIKTVLDGELFEIEPPLCFEMHPKKITVMVP